MSTSGDSCPNEDPDPVLLRWSDSPNMPSREALGDMVEADAAEAVISTTVHFCEHTQVYLVKRDYTETGVVRSCLSRGGRFIVTIHINSTDRKFPRDPHADPGVLAVDSFLTEEQELQILRDLEEELRGDHP